MLLINTIYTYRIYLCRFCTSTEKAWDPVTIVAQCEERKVLSSRTTIEYYSEYIVIHVDPPLVASGEFTVYIVY